MDNTDTKSEDENYHISEDSGNCDQSTPPPLVGFLLKNKINKPKLSFLDKLTGEDCGGAGNGDVLENDDVTLYSDSFNTDSHSSCSNEEGSDIKNANLRTSIKVADNKKTQKTVNIVLRSHSLKKIYTNRLSKNTINSSHNILFKNTRFNSARSKSTSQCMPLKQHQYSRINSSKTLNGMTKQQQKNTIICNSNIPLKHLDFKCEAQPNNIIVKTNEILSTTHDSTEVLPCKLANDSEVTCHSSPATTDTISLDKPDSIKSIKTSTPTTRLNTANIVRENFKEIKSIETMETYNRQKNQVDETKPRGLISQNSAISLASQNSSISNSKQSIAVQKSLQSIRSKTLINSVKSPATTPLGSNQQDQNRIIDRKKHISSMQTKTTITVDTSKARSNLEVVTECVKKLEWQDCPSGLNNQNCDIIWLSINQEFEPIYNSLQSQVKINKFPYMSSVLKKGPLTRALNVMRQIYKNEYNFYPRTWFLPEELREFRSECRYIHEKQYKSNQVSTTFILKPNDGSQGDGIYLIKDSEEYLKLIPKKHRSRPYIVQEYIHNPFLIDGLKSDLRLYVVITSIKPLEIYLCDEGLVRFATINYQFPDESNYRSSFMHLTNYSINKKNEDYKFFDKERGAIKVNLIQQGSYLTKTFADNTGEKQPSIEKNSREAGEGSKRKFSTVIAYIEKMGYNVCKLLSEIDDLVVKTVVALMPEIKVNCAFDATKFQGRLKASYFQILGFDILLTDNLKPMLIEVNSNPSLRIDYEITNDDGTKTYIPSQIDMEIKKPLVFETLKVVAPKKKLDIIEQCKRKEEQIEKAKLYRNSLVKQRIDERNQQKLIQRQFDYNKCPLLSKPGEQYIKKLSAKKSTPRSHSLFNEFHSSLRNSSSCMISDNNMPNAIDNKINNQFTAKSSLRNIYNILKQEDQYEYLFSLDAIADIFINFTISSGTKNMSHTNFRMFVKNCNLVNEKTTLENLDIIFFDLSKRWQLYNRRKINPDNSEAPDLCYQAFVQFFLTFSQLNFSEENLEKNLRLMISHCQLGMKPVELIKIVVTQDNECDDIAIGSFDIREDTRPKTCAVSNLGSAESRVSIKSGNSRVIKPLFSTTEKYTLTTGSSSSAKSFNRIDLKNIDLKKLTPMVKQTNKSKKSLFPIFFDSSTKA